MIDSREYLISLAILATPRITLLSKNSILLIGLAIIILALCVAGGILFSLINRAHRNRPSKQTLPVDTSHLPQIPREDVASVFTRHETPPATPAPPIVNTPPFNTLIPSASPVTPQFLLSMPTPIPHPSLPVSPTPTPMSMRTLMNRQKSSMRRQTSPSIPALPMPEQVPETPRPHPKTNENMLQQQPAEDVMLEALIRLAQRGIFATPGKKDLIP